MVLLGLAGKILKGHINLQRCFCLKSEVGINTRNNRCKNITCLVCFAKKDVHVSKWHVMGKNLFYSGPLPVLFLWHFSLLVSLFELLRKEELVYDVIAFDVWYSKERYRVRTTNLKTMNVQHWHWDKLFVVKITTSVVLKG